MALADIRKKIEQDAANEAAKLLDEARAQAAALEKEADDKRKEMDRLVKEEVERLKREGVADTTTQNDNDASDGETAPTDIPEKAEDKE